ncbi:hypothetical protein PanWU01x14_366480, partial [Parasponia andersonii]
ERPGPVEADEPQIHSLELFESRYSKLLVCPWVLTQFTRELGIIIAVSLIRFEWGPDLQEHAARRQLRCGVRHVSVGE